MTTWVLMIILHVSAGTTYTRLSMPDEASCSVAQAAVARSRDAAEVFCVATKGG